MIRAEECVLILLAAGRSERFGAVDKLIQDYRGTPLAFHVVTAMEGVPFKARLAVCSGTALDFTGRGYHVLYNPDSADGMSGSLKLGVRAARAIGCAAVVVALADMPRVTATHLHRLLDAATGRDAVVASSDGIQPSPPAVIGADRFDALLALEGDAGARALVRGGHHVIAPAAELLDIDVPADLARLREMD